MGKVIYRQPLGHNVNNQEAFFCREGQKDYKIIFFSFNGLKILKKIILIFVYMYELQGDS